MSREWVISIRDQCAKARVPFFFKQWGGVHKKPAGRVLDGKSYDEFPPPLQGAVPVDGGSPLLVQGKLIGAIGVSGDLAEHDGQCATAGAAALTTTTVAR